MQAWTSALLGILASLVATAIGATGAVALRRWRLASRYKKLVGCYREYKVGPRPRSLANVPTGAIVTLEYRGDGVLSTSCQHPDYPEHAWKGQLRMDPFSSDEGRGWYRYLNRADLGHHLVMYERETRRFFVSGKNFSHEGGVAFTTSWIAMPQVTDADPH
jgi:hypothetical protein